MTAICALVTLTIQCNRNPGKLFMMELNVEQGTSEWLKERGCRLAASDAPAMMGVSKYIDRKALITERALKTERATSHHTAALFEAGHKAEKAARDLFNATHGFDFQPKTFVTTIDGMDFIASLDGYYNGTIFEHKLWNNMLADYIKTTGTVPDTHIWQLHHQMMVTGADKVVFMVSDGTAVKSIFCTVYRDPIAEKQLLSGWRLFQSDVVTCKSTIMAREAANAKPSAKPRAKPGAMVKLSIKTDFRVLSHNLDTFKDNAKAFIDSINTDPQTDEEFASAELGVKACKKAEDSLKEARNDIINQSADINILFSTLDNIQEDIRQSRLKLEKAIKAKKEAIKRRMIDEATVAIKAIGITDNYAEQLSDAIASHRTARTMQAAIDSFVTAKRVEVDSGTYQDIPAVQDLAAIIGYSQAKLVYDAIKAGNIRGVAAM